VHGFSCLVDLLRRIGQWASAFDTPRVSVTLCLATKVVTELADSDWADFSDSTG